MQTCRHIALMAALSFVVNGCGAPVKSAAEVASIFDGDSRDLDSKLTALCAELKSRQRKPNLDHGGISMSNCDNAGRAAVNLNSTDEFAFLGLEDGEEVDEGVVKIHVRSQVWLNKSLLGLATILGAKMKEKEGADAGEVDLGGDKISNIDKLIDIQTEMLKEPKLDIDNLAFELALRITATGIIDLDNTIEAHGKMLGNAFAVTASTTEDQVIEKSLLKSFRMTVLVIPHASDVYVDLFMDVDIHSVGGLFDTVVKEKLQPALTSGMKDMLTALLGLDE